MYVFHVFICACDVRVILNVDNNYFRIFFYNSSLLK